MASGQALLFVDELRSRLQIVALDPVEYYESIKSAAAEDIVGGTIYDLLLTQCALKTAAEVIYTLDSHFARFETEIAKRVRTP
jgi:predicted nucleic acid-binding protein